MLTPAQIQAFMPATRGPFTFPAPYNTQGTRVTNSTDCGGADCVDYVGYSYWRNMNNSAGSNTMLVFLTLDRARGGVGPSLFQVDKTSLQVTSVGPLFDAADHRSWATGEGWYFSATRPTTLYVLDNTQLTRYDVNSHATETVFDIGTQYGAGSFLWQANSSNDDRVHSATLKDATYNPLGCVVYREDTKQLTLYPATGAFDECQVDKGGHWLLIKENTTGINEDDNVWVNLDTGVQSVLTDANGAAGHSDNGYGCIIAEDNWAALPGSAKLWVLPNLTSSTLVYNTMSWSVDVGHVSFLNARNDLPLSSQYACISHAGANAAARANELSCFMLDGSERVLVVAPVMTDLAAPGGFDSYGKLPKANIDVTGQFMIWTTNMGGSRLDAVIVRVPAGLLTGAH
jgi:hypothetical protein